MQSEMRCLPRLARAFSGYNGGTALEFKFVFVYWHVPYQEHHASCNTTALICKFLAVSLHDGVG